MEVVVSERASLVEYATVVSETGLRAEALGETSDECGGTGGACYRIGTATGGAQRGR